MSTDRRYRLCCAAAVNCGSTCSGTHFEVIGEEELGGSQEVEDEPKHVAVPIDEVVLLQAVQHYGLRAIEQPADSAPKEETQVKGGQKNNNFKTTEALRASPLPL